MSDQLYCPECADKWSGAYNTDHRCVTCGSPLKAEAADDELERVKAERDALAAHLEAAAEVIGNIDAGMDEREQWIRDKPTTSLAHRDAEKQAEVLDKLRRGLLRNSNAFVLKTLEVEASKLRHQSQEDL